MGPKSGSHRHHNGGTILLRERISILLTTAFPHSAVPTARPWEGTTERSREDSWLCPHIQEGTAELPHEQLGTDGMGAHGEGPSPLRFMSPTPGGFRRGPWGPRAQLRPQGCPSSEQSEAGRAAGPQRASGWPPLSCWLDQGQGSQWRDMSWTGDHWPPSVKSGSGHFRRQSALLPQEASGLLGGMAGGGVGFCPLYSHWPGGSCALGIPLSAKRGQNLLGPRDVTLLLGRELQTALSTE